MLFEEKLLRTREMLRKLCQWKGVEIIEGGYARTVYKSVSIPPKMSFSGFMDYLKGKSALVIFQKRGNIKFDREIVIRCEPKVVLFEYEPKNYVQENEEGCGHKEYKKTGRKSVINDLPVYLFEPSLDRVGNLLEKAGNFAPYILNCLHFICSSVKIN